MGLRPSLDPAAISRGLLVKHAWRAASPRASRGARSSPPPSRARPRFWRGRPRRPPTPSGPGSLFRIHPGIGIARLGNADPEQFFIGPEVPSYGPSGDAPGTQVPPYKASGLIKPQAARFRIFRYEQIGGLLTPIEEITLDSPYVVNIEWKAHLANKKASFHQFQGPAGESSPYSTTFVSTAPAPLRNTAVTASRAQLLEIEHDKVGGIGDGRRGDHDDCSGDVGFSAPEKPQSEIAQPGLPFPLVEEFSQDWVFDGHRNLPNGRDAVSAQLDGSGLAHDGEQRDVVRRLGLLPAEIEVPATPALRPSDGLVGVLGSKAHSAKLAEEAQGCLTSVLGNRHDLA